MIVGVDVSKDRLEISNLSRLKSCDNEVKSIDKFIKELIKEKASMVVFEATGGYESKLINALSDSPIPMAMVNARQVRSFADAMNLVKTDKIDAEIIAKFAQVANIKAQVKKDINQKACDELISRRRQLIGMQTAELNRLEHASKSILKEMEAHIAYLVT